MPVQCRGTVNSALSSAEPDFQEGDIECLGVAKSLAVSCYLFDSLCCGEDPVLSVVFFAVRMNALTLFHPLFCR